jgi:hypothetical protein
MELLSINYSNIQAKLHAVSLIILGKFALQAQQISNTDYI